MFSLVSCLALCRVLASPAVMPGDLPRQLTNTSIHAAAVLLCCWIMLSMSVLVKLVILAHLLVVAGKIDVTMRKPKPIMRACLASSDSWKATSTAGRISYVNAPM